MSRVARWEEHSLWSLAGIPTQPLTSCVIMCMLPGLSEPIFSLHTEKLFK